MPCHHNLETYLSEYVAAAGLADEPKTPLFRSARGKTRQLTEKPMRQGDVYTMIRRRQIDAGIGTQIGCHSFRATGITTYRKNGGNLEVAQEIERISAVSRPLSKSVRALATTAAARLHTTAKFSTVITF